MILLVLDKFCQQAVAPLTPCPPTYTSKSSQLRLESTTSVFWKRLYFNSWQQHVKCLNAMKANSQSSESRKTSNTNWFALSQEQTWHRTFTLTPKPSSFIDYSDTSLDLISMPFASHTEVSKYIAISLIKHLMANTRIIALIKTFKRVQLFIRSVTQYSSFFFCSPLTLPVCLLIITLTAHACIATHITLIQHSEKGKIKNTLDFGVEISFSLHIWRKLWKSFVHSKGKKKNKAISITQLGNNQKRGGVTSGLEKH